MDRFKQVSGEADIFCNDSSFALLFLGERLGVSPPCPSAQVFSAASYKQKIADTDS